MSKNTTGFPRRRASARLVSSIRNEDVGKVCDLVVCSLLTLPKGVCISNPYTASWQQSITRTMRCDCRVLASICDPLVGYGTSWDDSICREFFISRNRASLRSLGFDGIFQKDKSLQQRNNVQVGSLFHQRSECAP